LELQTLKESFLQQVYLQDQTYYKIKKIRVSKYNKEVLSRFDAVCRFESAFSKGLSSVDAAKVLGLARSTLYKLLKNKTMNIDSLNSKSRRPKSFRKPKNRSEIAIRIEQLRQEYPRY
jgi:hypothetical protein